MWVQQFAGADVKPHFQLSGRGWFWQPTSQHPHHDPWLVLMSCESHRLSSLNGLPDFALGCCRCHSTRVAVVKWAVLGLPHGAMGDLRDRHILRLSVSEGSKGWGIMLSAPFILPLRSL